MRAVYGDLEMDGSAQDIAYVLCCLHTLDAQQDSVTTQDITVTVDVDDIAHRVAQRLAETLRITTCTTF